MVMAMPSTNNVPKIGVVKEGRIIASIPEPDLVGLIRDHWEPITRRAQRSGYPVIPPQDVLRYLDNAEDRQKDGADVFFAVALQELERQKALNPYLN